MPLSTPESKTAPWYNKELFRILLPVLGIALFWPFQRFSSFYPQFSGMGFANAPTIQSFFIIFLLLEIVIMLIIIFSRHNIEPLFRSNSKKIALSCSLIGLGGSLLLLKSSQNDTLSLFGFSIDLGVGLLLLAFYGTFMFIAWGCLFAERTAKEAAFIIVMGALISSALYLFLYIYPEFDLVRSVASPSLAALLLAFSFAPETNRNTMDEPNISYDFASFSKMLPKPPVILGLSAIVVGMLYIRLLSSLDTLSISAPERILTQYGLILIFGILCFYVHFYSPGSRFINAISAISISIMLLGLLMVILLSTNGLFFYGAAIIKLSCDVFEIILWLTAILVVAKHNASRCLVFGLYALCCYIAPSLFPDIFAQSLYSFLDFTQPPYIISTTAVLLFIFSILTITVIFFSNNHRNRLDDQQEKSSEQLLTICVAIGKEKSLTTREIEVWTLYCQGHTLKGVADKLNLATTTIQGYSRSLYQKLGVHSRQELIDLIDVQVSSKNTINRP